MVKENQKVKNWDKKHAAILEVATKIFINQGYVATSMELIAREACVSKITIYKHFKNKTDLFSHIMESHCSRILDFSPIIESSPTITTKETLLSFCHSFVESLLKPDSVRLMRRIIGEADAFPELITHIWRGGRLPMLEAFCLYLQEESDKKRIRVQDAGLAGRQLLGMIKENLVYPVWFGVKPCPSPSEKTHVIQKCVDMFLGFYEPTTSESALLTFC